MHLLGKNLPDGKLVKIAILKFTGIGKVTARRLIARLSIHDQCLVSQLTEAQTTSLASYLSSPLTHEGQGYLKLANPAGLKPIPQNQPQHPVRKPGWQDPMDNLLIESDLRRRVNEAINHERQIGTYRGRRMAMGFPVNGQRTRTNARTARKLNANMSARAARTS